MITDFAIYPTKDWKLTRILTYELNIKCQIMKKTWCFVCVMIDNKITVVIAKILTSFETQYAY